MPARAKFKGGDQSETSQCYVTPNALILIAALSLTVVAHPAQAEVMSAAEIAEQIVDKDLVARRMGARVICAMMSAAQSRSAPHSFPERVVGSAMAIGCA